MRNLTTGLAQRADCSDEPLDASYFRCWSEPERARLSASGVGGSGDAGHMIGTAAPDPDRTRCLIIREGAVSTS